jgi:hypothetical protein
MPQRDKRSLQSTLRFEFEHKHVRLECAHRTISSAQQLLRLIGDCGTGE